MLSKRLLLRLLPAKHRRLFSTAPAQADKTAPSEQSAKSSPATQQEQKIAESGADMTVVIRSQTASLPSAPTSPLNNVVSTITQAFKASSVPEQMQSRRVRIYRPAKNAMQSGTNETQLWQVDFDTEQKWANPLMGYTSSADPVQALRLRFHQKQEAIAFVENQGWDYIVQEDQLPIFKPKSYANNFKHIPGKIKLVHTK